MGLSKKVLLLWGGRLFAVNILLYPLADYFKSELPTLPLLFGTDCFLLILLLCKYKSLQILLQNNKLRLSHGILFFKSVSVNLQHTCAYKEISTPLSRKLNLYNLIIYCEGVRVFLPPTSTAFNAEIKYRLKGSIK